MPLLAQTLLLGFQLLVEVAYWLHKHSTRTLSAAEKEWLGWLLVLWGVMLRVCELTLELCALLTDALVQFAWRTVLRRCAEPVAARALRGAAGRRRRGCGGSRCQQWQRRSSRWNGGARRGCRG